MISLTPIYSHADVVMFVAGFESSQTSSLFMNALLTISSEENFNEKELEEMFEDVRKWSVEGCRGYRFSGREYGRMKERIERVFLIKGKNKHDHKKTALAELT